MRGRVLVAMVAVSMLGVAPSPAPAQPPAPVLLAGGTAAISDDVTAEVEAIVGRTTRVRGADRYATAAAAAAAVPAGSPVIIASGESFADALAGAPLAVAEGAAVLLTRRDDLPSATVDALQDLGPSSITILGGTAAVSADVEAALAGLTDGTVTRLAGPDRYTTAAAVAERFAPPANVVYVASGEGFADALAGAAVAASVGAPVLLTATDQLPGSTAAALDRLTPSRVVLLGGTAAISADVETMVRDLVAGDVDRISGPDRYATAAAVALDGYPDGAGAVALASGEGFADALAIAPAVAGGRAASFADGDRAAFAQAGESTGPVLLTRPTDLPDITAEALRTLLDVEQNPAEEDLPPTADDVAAETAAGTPVDITLVGEDPEGQPLTYAIAEGPAIGTVTVDGGTATYTPSGSGYTTTFTYTAADATQSSEPATVTITVTSAPGPGPTAPVASDDTLATDEDTALPIPAADLLANDTDPQPADAAALTITDIDTTATTGLLTGPTGGPYSYDPAGTFDVLPAGATRADTFGYTVSDPGGNTDTAVVTVTVTGVNDAPASMAFAAEAVRENQPAGQLVGTLSATDVDTGDTHAYRLVTGAGDDDNDSFVIVEDVVRTAGPLTVTDAPYTFRVSATDEAGAVVEDAFTVTPGEINDAPSFALRLTTVLSREDDGATTVRGLATDILAGPPDEAGQTVTFDVTSDDDALFATPPAIDEVSGDLTFQPAADANGDAEVTVVLSDDGGTADGGVDTSAPQTFTIEIHPVNDVPSFALPATPDQAVLEDAGAQTVAGFVTDISTGPANESDQTPDFDVTSDNDGLFADVPSINAAGDLTYTPADDAFGTATVTVVLTDDGGTALGGSDTSAAQTFAIGIAPVNDAPSVTLPADPGQSVAEDAGAQTVRGFASFSTGPANESGQTIDAPRTTISSGLAFDVPPSINPAGDLTYTPADDAFGTATVTVAITDDGGTANGGVDTSADRTFTIEVRSVNDAPTFTLPSPADRQTTNDQGPIDEPGFLTSASAGPANESGQRLSVDLTTDDDALFETLPTIDLTTGTLSYDPAAGADGAATVTVRLADDGGTETGGVDASEQTFTITIVPPNAVPAAQDGSADALAGTPVDIVLTATDADDDDLTFAIATPPTAGSLGAIGTPDCSAVGTCTASVTWTPDPGSTDDDSFTFTAADARATSARATVSITVNDAPVLGRADRTVDSIGNVGLEVTSRDGNNLLDDATDPEGDTLVVTVESAGTTTEGGQFTTAADGTWTYTPAAGFEGDDDFAYEVCDDGAGPACTSGTVTITVADVIWFIDSDAPSGGDGRITSPFDSTQAFGLANRTGIAPAPVTGQVIHITGSADVIGSLELRDRQTVIGSGSSVPLAAAAGIDPVPTDSRSLPVNGGTPPVVTSPNNIVDLAVDNTLRGFTIRNSGVTALAGTAFGTLRVDEIAIAGAGIAIDLMQGEVAGPGAAALGHLTSVETTGISAAVRLRSVTGQLEIPAGALRTSSGPAVAVTGSPAPGAVLTLRIGAAVTNDADIPTVHVQNQRAASITLSGAVRGGDVLLDDNLGSTITLSGPLAVQSDVEVGFTARHGGTVVVSDPASTIEAVNQTALRLEGVTIGADGVTFAAVSSATTTDTVANGVVVGGTGSTGRLTINGGRVEGTTGSSVLLDDVHDVALDAMTLRGSDGSGVQATDLTGAVTITNMVIEDVATHGISILNQTGTADSVTAAANTLRARPAAGTTGSALRLIARGAASVPRAALDDNTVEGGWGSAAIQAQGGSIAGPGVTFGTPDTTDVISISRNTLTAETDNPMQAEGILATQTHSGRAAFVIEDNGTTTPMGTIRGVAIAVSAFGEAVVHARVTGNAIASGSTFAAAGIVAGTGSSTGDPTQSPELVLSVTDNTVTGTGGEGILIVGDDAAALVDATVLANVVQAPTDPSFNGILVASANGVGTGGEVSTTCLDLHGNTSAGSGVPGIGLARTARTGDHVFGLPDLTGDVVAFVDGNNPAGGGTRVLEGDPGFTDCTVRLP